MGLISKEAALAAIDHEREMLIEQRLLGAEHVVVHHARRLIEDMQTVPAVPLDKLCEWLSENSNIIPCTCCANFVNEYCTAIGDRSRPCPNSADDWRQAITKWMEEQHD